MKKENKPADGKKEPDPRQVQQRKKMLVFLLFFLIFAGAMWLIFAPSAGDKAKEEQNRGFNPEIPMPKEEGIIEDKGNAYEQEAFREKEREKMKSLQEFSFLFEDNESIKQESISPNTEEDFSKKQPETSSSAIASSVNAYKNINRQQRAWYDEPAEEIDEQAQLELQWRIQELERKQKESEDRSRIEDEQLKMIEKSYQMAAKYMPQTSGQAVTENKQPASSTSKPVAVPIGEVRKNVVSTLAAELEHEDFVKMYKEPRNLGFLTAAAKENRADKNTIHACVHQTVTLTNGKEVQIRLMEPMQAGETVIPANTVITGICRINGERLEITVGSILHASRIIPVELETYDLDGIRGVFIPNSDELNALKEVTASLATTAGTSIMISDKASSQLAADVGKGLIQGTSQYINKKLTTVKVTVKAGYCLLLLPKKQ